MFLNKKLREADKLITTAELNRDETNSDPSVIDVKINSQDQLFSAYSYSGDKLNADFSEFVLDRAKSVPINDDITVKIHTSEAIDAAEVEQTIKSHFRTEYMQTKKEVKRISVISAVMTLLGIIALTALILINHFTDNLYITSIVEIAAWVFIWEAVDYFFLQRPVIKAKCILIQRIFMAKIELCKIEPLDTL